jgi:hypothetical protein
MRSELEYPVSASVAFIPAMVALTEVACPVNGLTISYTAREYWRRETCSPPVP